MATLAVPDSDLVGRVAHVEPMRQWGYLYGSAGERVYFHASVIAGAAELRPGDEVSYALARGSAQLCAARIRRRSAR